MTDTTQATIVLPLDGSESSERAQRLALALAERMPARLVLVGAPEVYGLDMAWYAGAAPESGAPMVPVTELMDEARQATTEMLSARRTALDHAGIEVEARVVEDLPASAILETAESSAADLIVMATHGLGGFSRWALGSVADKVLQSSTRPVLLVRAGAEHLDPGLDQILVPLDGSELAEAVLPAVERLARAMGSRLTLAHVSPEARLGMETSRLFEAQRHSIERIEAYLAGQAERLMAAGIPTDIEFLASPGVAGALVERLERGDIDLVALTTHGRGGLKRWAFGSVADKLIRHAPTPVLVVRNQGEAAAEG